MNKQARRALAAAFVLLLLFLFWQLLPKFIASWAEEQIAKGLAGSFSAADLITVDLSPAGLSSWTQGRLEDLKIEGRGLRTKDGFPISALFFEAKLLQLDWAELWKGKVEVISSHGARATCVLAEGELSAYLQKQIEVLKDVRIQLAAGKATLFGTAELLGRDVKLSIAGDFSPKEGDLQFTPTDFFVADFKLPRFLLNNLSKQVNFIIPLGKLPLPLELESVRIENGHAYLAGRGDRL